MSRRRRAGLDRIRHGCVASKQEQEMNTMVSRKQSILLTGVLVLVSGLASAQAPAGPAALAVVQPAMECERLAVVDISQAVGAPTHITAATSVKDGKPAPYCQVKGYVEPANRFEVRLPLTTWTQRYVQTGCGGLCGSIGLMLSNPHGCMPATNGELALASTDMGHHGGMDGSFGAKDYQLRVDFAYRSLHVTALAAKALIAQFYGQGPKYSYFNGCSDGGREALIEAQRYPDDFNGITAGAPAMNFTTQNSFYHGWNVLANLGPDGKPLLTADKLPILHKAVLDQCDAGDGLKDGLVSDPLNCHPDLSVIECKPGQDEKSCLTPAQTKAARELYAGAHDAEGNKLTLSGPLPGSELAWAGVLIPPPGVPFVMSRMIATGALQNLMYEQNPPAGYTLEKDLKFDRASFAATTRLHALYDATDPDLTPFAANGGKLILWHGLADPHISPLNTIAYYTAMQNLLGKEKVDQFARLFLFPGGYHCGGGEGPFDFGLMQAIMTWVEGGQKPAELVASHSTGSGHGAIAGVPSGPGGPGEHDRGPAIGPGSGGPMEASAAAEVDRTRPVYPYPFIAKYTGTGSIDDAANFVEGEARPVSFKQLEWLGSGFFAPHYEIWCEGKGTELVCKAPAKK
jgi:feruloyl esterase